MFSKILAAAILTLATSACSTTNFVTLERFEQLNRQVTDMDQQLDQMREQQYLSTIWQMVSQPNIKPGCWYEYKEGNLIIMGADPDDTHIKVGLTTQEGNYCTYRWYYWQKDEYGNVTFQQTMRIDTGARQSSCTLRK